MENSIIRYQVTGMACGGCLNVVKDALASYADVVNVTLEPPIAVLTNPHASMETMNASLAKLGQYRLSQLATP